MSDRLLGTKIEVALVWTEAGTYDYFMLWAVVCVINVDAES